MPLVRVQAEPFDSAVAVRSLHEGRTDVGAVVTFMGYCRDDDGTLAALELEHFPGMAEAELARIAAVAEARWPLFGTVVIHRFGRIVPGEAIVLVATASAHRAAAFAAADFLMDILKTDAPFWKRAVAKAGVPDPRDAEAWVAAKSSDVAAVGRWR